MFVKINHSVAGCPSSLLYVCVLCAVLSCIQLCATLWTVAHQAPVPMGFSRQESWSRLPCPPPGDLPDPEIKHASFMSLALAGSFPLAPPDPTLDLQNQKHWGGVPHIVFEQTARWFWHLLKLSTNAPAFPFSSFLFPLISKQQVTGAKLDCRPHSHLKTWEFQ